MLTKIIDVQKIDIQNNWYW